MNPASRITSRQPKRLVIPLERLRQLRARAVGAAIETSTSRNYASALNSYLSFIKSYDIDAEPNPDTLSLYIAFMCENGIKPRSVGTYLTGLCHELLAHFPNIQQWRTSHLVSRTLKGYKKLKGTQISRKLALTTADLSKIISAYPSPSFDDSLFMALITTGFFGLMRLGELTYPDNKHLRDPRKLIRRASVKIDANQFSFLLPFHKADRFYEGNRVIIRASTATVDPHSIFKAYVKIRDQRFPYHSALWVTDNGQIPTRKFFISRLRQFFGSDISGHSMRAGGATLLAENNTPPHLIQAIGRWSSDAWQIYVRKNPVLIHALLHPQTH